MTPVAPIERVLLLMAMRDEASPLIDALGLAPVDDVLDQRLPMRCFQGRVGGLTVSLVIAGVDDRYGVDYVGTEPATLMAYEAMRCLDPQLVMSVGTAGGFAAHGADVGTVYVSSEHFVYHDHHVPLPGLRESAMGYYPALGIDRLRQDLGLSTGVISSGSSLEKSEHDLRTIESHHAVAKEMEVAAIAWVGMLLDVPVMAIKSITNLVDLDNRSESEFVNNFDRATSALCATTQTVLDYLQGKSLLDLDGGVCSGT